MWSVNLTQGSWQWFLGDLNLPKVEISSKPRLIIIDRIHLNILTTKLLVKENFCVFPSIPLQGFISKQPLEKYTQKKFWLKSMDWVIVLIKTQP